MNVLVICLSRAKGGLGSYMCRTVKALGKRHNVFPVVPPGWGMVRQFLIDDGLEFTELSPWLREFPLLTAWKLARFIDAHQIDSIHATWRGDLPVCALAKLFSRRKPRLVYTVQMKISRSKNDPYHNFIYRQVDAFLTITRQLRQQVQARIHPALRDRVTTHYYGIPRPGILAPRTAAALRRKFNFPEEAMVVGLIGRKDEGKGQHLLIEALAMTNQTGLNIFGLIAGEAVNPPYENRLRGMVEREGLSGKTLLMGWIKNPARLMQICDVVLLASYQETFGLVLPEAMSVGIAVVGSDAGGVPEIITHRRTGMLFKTRDSESLCTVLTELYNDPELRKRLALAGQREVRERFPFEGHYQRLEEFLLPS